MPTADSSILEQGTWKATAKSPLGVTSSGAVPHGRKEMDGGASFLFLSLGPSSATSKPPAHPLPHPCHHRGSHMQPPAVLRSGPSL